MSSADPFISDLTPVDFREMSIRSGTAMLPNKSLVQLCSHLGALNMFPHRLAAALDTVLSQRDCGQHYT